MHEETFWGNPRTWVAVAFVIFFVLFGRKIWAALATMLDARSNAIRTELAEAARLRSEAEAMLREAEAQRAQALVDAAAMLEGARHEAERLAAAAAVDAEAANKRFQRMAIERIAGAEKAAIEEVRHAAVDVATAAARQVLAEGLPAETSAALIDHAISGLPAALRAA
jgi:F-type H+-transporting ATPase subunit b